MAAGVNAMLLAGTTAAICQLQALSPVGRCKTFDSTADGYGRGEGFAVVVLSHATSAITPGCEAGSAPAATTTGPYAIICAGAVNQDGRSSGLTAPNGPSQTALVQQALVSGQLQASNVGTISVHGTGTPLGDPIEVGALGQGLRFQRDSGAEHTRGHPLELVSNKSCFGHTEGAAGLTGLLLAVGCLQDASRPPIMHLGNPNPHVGAAFADWQRQLGLTAAVPRQTHGDYPAWFHCLCPVHSLLTCTARARSVHHGRAACSLLKVCKSSKMYVSYCIGLSPDVPPRNTHRQHLVQLSRSATDTMANRCAFSPHQQASLGKF